MRPPTEADTPGRPASFLRHLFAGVDNDGVFRWDELVGVAQESCLAIEEVRLWCRPGHRREHRDADISTAHHDCVYLAAISAAKYTQ